MTSDVHPTTEQVTICQTCVGGANVAVQAGAGTGKTKTLVETARRIPRRRTGRGRYFTYNSAMAREAKTRFPTHVWCSTIHSAAFKPVGAAFADRNRVPLSKGQGAPRQFGWHVAQILGITRPIEAGKVLVPPKRLGRIITDTLDKFCQGIDPEITAAHVPAQQVLSDDANESLARQLVPLARKAWRDVCDLESGQLNVKHDYYLRCQPPGTMVTVVSQSHHGSRNGGQGRKTEWRQVPIEDIRPGDSVVTWHGPRFGSIRKTGREVARVGQRQYDGDLVTVTADTGETSSYTADHICIATVTGELAGGNHVVYLMRRGNDYRVGQTPWRIGSQGKVIGPIHRAWQQKADAVWILSVHESKQEAALAEALVQHEFNLPGWQFTPSRGQAEVFPLDQLWNKIGDNAEQATACLAAHGRDIRYPFWHNKLGHYWFRRPAEIRACNLLDGMQVCVPGTDDNARYGIATGSWTGAWRPVTVSRQPYSGPVHSLEVAIDHTYIADGIVTHNCWFDSGRARIDADFIMLDEAQDANPLATELLIRQHTQLIAVGDSAQTLYEWRGACDALRVWPQATELFLTQSFRFGNAVAEWANMALGLIRSRMQIHGTPSIPSVIGPLSNPDAILCRTNAGALTAAIGQHDAGRKAALASGGKAIKEFARAAAELQAGQQTAHPDLFAFPSWLDVQRYVEEEDAGDLKMLVDLVDGHGAVELEQIVDTLMGNAGRAEVVASTVHGAKGLEWGRVKIGDDFPSPGFDEAGRRRPVRLSQGRLAYVALTRAKLALDPGGLGWVRDWHLDPATARAVLAG